jgi:ribosome-binding factor A
MSVRIERVNQLLQAELSQLILRELKDPRLGSLLSITQVDTAADLSYARVYVSIMAPSGEQATVLRGLDTAKGFLWQQLRSRLKLRRTPQLRFIQDTSIQHGSEVLRLINTVAESAHPESEERA